MSNAIRQLVQKTTRLSLEDVCASDQFCHMLAPSAQLTQEGELKDGVLTPEEIMAPHLTSGKLVVTEVLQGGPAQLFGVQPGDIVLALNGQVPHSVGATINLKGSQVGDSQDNKGYESILLLQSSQEVVYLEFSPLGTKLHGLACVPDATLTLHWANMMMVGKNADVNVNFTTVIRWDIFRCVAHLLELGDTLGADIIRAFFPMLEADGYDENQPAGSTRPKTGVRGDASSWRRFLEQNTQPKNDCCSCGPSELSEATNIAITTLANIQVAGKTSLPLLAIGLAMSGEPAWSTHVLGLWDLFERSFTCDFHTQAQIARLYNKYYGADRGLDADDFMDLVVRCRGESTSLQAGLARQMLARCDSKKLLAFEKAIARDTRVGFTVPEYTLKPVNSLSPELAAICSQDGGHVSLKTQLLSMNGDQLLCIVFMGCYRTNGPYDSLMQNLIEMSDFFPSVIAGVHVLYDTNKSETNDEFTRNWITHEKVALSMNLPIAILHDPEQYKWEEKLNKASNNENFFTGCPTVLYVNHKGKILCSGYMDATVVTAIAKNQESNEMAGKRASLPVASLVKEKSQKVLDDSALALADKQASMRSHLKKQASSSKNLSAARKSLTTGHTLMAIPEPQDDMDRHSYDS
jgi:hypothetical protein